MLQLSCVVCAQPFEAKRRDARYCGSVCKMRAHRAGGSVTTMAGDVGGVPDVGSSASEVTLVDVVRRELVAAGRLDSFAGQRALTLAERILSPVTSAGAVAGLDKRLSVARAEALAGMIVEADAVDEFTARLREKQKAASA
jgi:hypothetical protein